MESHATKLKNQRGQVLIELIAAIGVLLAFVVALVHLNILSYKLIESFQLFNSSTVNSQHINSPAAKGPVA